MGKDVQNGKEYQGFNPLGFSAFWWIRQELPSYHLAVLENEGAVIV